mgnify:FL=1
MFILNTNDVETALFAKGQIVNRTSINDTSGSAMLTSRNFVKGRQRTLFSGCRNLVVGMAMSVKLASSESSTDLDSPMSVIGVEIRSM